MEEAVQYIQSEYMHNADMNELMPCKKRHRYAKQEMASANTQADASAHHTLVFSNART